MCVAILAVGMKDPRAVGHVPSWMIRRRTSISYCRIPIQGFLTPPQLIPLQLFLLLYCLLVFFCLSRYAFCFVAFFLFCSRTKSCSWLSTCSLDLMSSVFRGRLVIYLSKGIRDDTRHGDMGLLPVFHTCATKNYVNGVTVWEGRPILVFGWTYQLVVPPRNPVCP